MRTPGVAALSAFLVWVSAGVGAVYQPAFSHGGAVSMLAFSPNGKLLASGGGGGLATVRIWNLSDGKLVAELDAHRAGITGLVFSPDGTKLVSGAWDCLAIVWDVARAQEIRRFEHDEGVTDLCFSPNGKLLATGSLDGKVRLFELESGKEVRRLSLQKRPREDVVSVGFTADGSAVGARTRHECLDPADLDKWANGPMTVWEVATGNRIDDGEELGERRARQTIPLRGFYRATFEHYSPDRKMLVRPHAYQPYALTFIEIASGRTRLSVPVPATAAAVSCRDIAWARDDGAIFVCSQAALAGVAKQEDPLDARALEACWADLTAEAPRAYRAGLLLSEAPEQGVALIRDKLAAQPDIDRLVADLDSPSFQVRQKAGAELEKRGPAALAGLRKALARSPALEFTCRAERIITTLGPDVVRSVRLVEVLSRIDTPEALQVLELMARGPQQPGSETDAAAEALRRIKQSTAEE